MKDCSSSIKILTTQDKSSTHYRKQAMEFGVLVTYQVNLNLMIIFLGFRSSKEITTATRQKFKSRKASKNLQLKSTTMKVKILIQMLSSTANQTLI